MSKIKATYKNREIPEDILLDKKKVAAFKEYVRLEILIKDYPKRHYPIHNPNVDITINADLAAPYHAWTKKIGCTKVGKDREGDRVRNGMLFPDYIEVKTIDEMFTIYKDIFQLLRDKGGKKRTYDNTLYTTKNRDIFDAKRTQIIEWFGRWNDAKEVQHKINQRWGYKPTLREVKEFYFTNQKEIENRRSELENEYGHLTITKTRGRAEQFAYIYDTQKKRYEESNYKVAHAKTMMEALDRMKKEIEGDRIILDINGKIDLDLTLNVNKTFSELSKRIPLLSFIVGTAASKAGLNPEKVMTQLQNSIYAKYTGVQGVWDGKTNQDLTILPSNQVYDWMQIKEDVVHDVDYEAVEMEIKDETEKKQVQTSREKLMAVLSEKKKKINYM